MSQERVEQPIAEYVVGYCFSHDFSMVALIKKLKPAWQKGKLNGVGGKLEPGESPREAMAREFNEEAGITTSPDWWLHFRTEQFSVEQENARSQVLGARVHHLATVCNSVSFSKIRTVERECIVKVEYPLRLTADRFIYNLPYLIPMAAILLTQPAENRPLP